MPKSHIVRKQITSLSIKPVFFVFVVEISYDTMKMSRKCFMFVLDNTSQLSKTWTWEENIHKLYSITLLKSAVGYQLGFCCYTTLQNSNYYEKITKQILIRKKLKGKCNSCFGMERKISAGLRVEHEHLHAHDRLLVMHFYSYKHLPVTFASK